MCIILTKVLIDGLELGYNNTTMQYISFLNNPVGYLANPFPNKTECITWHCEWLLGPPSWFHRRGAVCHTVCDYSDRVGSIHRLCINIEQVRMWSPTGSATASSDLCNWGWIKWQTLKLSQLLACLLKGYSGVNYMCR